VKLIVVPRLRAPRACRSRRRARARTSQQADQDRRALRRRQRHRHDGARAGAKLQEILKQPIDRRRQARRLGPARRLGGRDRAGRRLHAADGHQHDQRRQPALFKKLSYDPEKDFAPIARCITGVNALVVNNDVPVKTVAELVDYARRIPGKLNYAEASASQRCRPRCSTRWPA
jgi:hypothetical protein